jgi:two-component system NtrC family sensor kinase
MFEQDLRRTHEFRALTKDGREGWISVTGARIMHGGRLAGLVSITDITERKLAVEALRQSEERYRTILEEMEDAYFEVDLGGHLTFVNNSVCRDLGYSREELMGMSYKDFTIEDDIESVFRVFNEVYRTGVPNKGFPWNTIRKDGVRGCAETSVSLLRTDKGEIIGFRGVGRDITERRQAEEALRQSEENYKTLFDSSVIGMYVQDAETTKIVMANQIAAKMFGFSSVEEAIGINPLDFVHPEDRDKALEITIKEMFEQDLRRTHELRAVSKKGREGWISVTGARIMHEGRLSGLVSIADINLRKQVEETLRQSEENYRALFDSTVIGTFVLDAETMKVVMGNQAAAKMFGFGSVDEAIGVNPLDFIPPEDRERVLEIATKELFEQDLRRTHELQAITKDGRKIWISITGARIMHGGKLAGLISFTDITEQKRQNERLMMTDRLASLGELASGTAHELNNPLTSIIGFSQLLMEREVPDDILEDLKLICSEAQRAASVTKNLLTFARKHAPVKQPTQINNIIEDALKLRAYEHKANSIEAERQLDPDLPEIMVDYFQMQQVFLNIIINAEYFMIEAHKRGTLTITTKKQNHTVRISIVDDGPGIPPENLSRIFDPFFTTKEAGKGTGLGLSICHGIVSEHGGQIYARSQQGKGATFVVELPINSH